MPCEICASNGKTWMIDDANRCEPCAISHKAQVFARSMEFHHSLKVGDWVGVRYVQEPAERYGRVIAVAVKSTKEPWTPSQKHGNCYGVFRLRMDDGTLRDEHPEHLFKSEKLEPAEAA